MPKAPADSEMQMTTNRPIDRIRRPRPVPLRSIWPDEARDFTPWLADNLDVLAETGLGGLTVVGREVALPGTWRALDILAETADGRRIAVENQFGSADHDHLTRGLAYAVGLRAQALVLIGERHLPESVAVAEYLNRSGDSLGENDAIGVFLIEVAVDEVGGYLVPRLTPVTQPNSWRQGLSTSVPTTLGSVEAFLAEVPPQVRDEWRRAVEGWLDLDGGRYSFSSQAVALRLPKPERGDVAVFTAFTAGSAWVNQGYLREATGGAEVMVQRIDSLIETWLPQAVRGPRDYYARLDRPDAEAILAFGREIGVLFREAAESQP